MKNEKTADELFHNMECLEKNGIHLFDEGFIFEIINPETLEPLNPGEEGELVITSLKKEAFPIVRYRTRDLTSIIPGPWEVTSTLLKMFIAGLANRDSSGRWLVVGGGMRL